MLKNWCFWGVVLEKTLESPLDSKEMKSVHPKGNQSWLFIRRTDAETEVLILWPPDLKSQLIRKDPDTGKNWKAGGEGDDRGRDGWMVSLLNGQEFEQAPGDGEGQGSLVCCCPRGRQESDTTEWLKTATTGAKQVIKGWILENGGKRGQQEAACWCKGATITHFLLLLELERFEHGVAISCHLKVRLHFLVNAPDLKAFTVKQWKLKAWQTTSLYSFLNLLSGKRTHTINLLTIYYLAARKLKDKFNFKALWLYCIKLMAKLSPPFSQFS